MSFFSHLGSKASKFEFNISIDNVIGVYPSSYSVDQHTSEGIYVQLKRKNKSYRTKISLPVNGGYVPIYDKLKFTSTLYLQKKKKKKINHNVHHMLPKQFILRVCNARKHKIRWETTIDLSDYASIFGCDVNESFICQFSVKYILHIKYPFTYY